MGFLRWFVNFFDFPAPAPTPTPAPAPTPSPAPPPEPTGVVAALNVERAGSGLAPLTDDPRLAASAARWAQVMARGEALTHGDFAARISSVYPNTAAAEDIAEGTPTVAGVVALWMNSPPHRANILGPFTLAGAGVSTAADGTAYWCVDFAAR